MPQILTWLLQLQALGVQLGLLAKQGNSLVMIGDEVDNAHGLLFDRFCPGQLADNLKQNVQGVCCATREGYVLVPAYIMPYVCMLLFSNVIPSSPLQCKAHTSLNHKGVYTYV